ncbi:uncharacterized protein LOC110015555 [Oryzias latipes]|uniref:uncharacterized protein LOC110015555 n=1 Tax=Oryzias latipes TaxID=8090 RepID=UPI000CE205DD|nr:uncharacterized protein LOC110015555 [Oryzias latipes]
METQLREFLMERNIAEELIKKLEDENIDAAVIPLMSDTDLAKYIPKVGDRVSTVAFCRRTALSESGSSRKESILSRLRQRVSGTEEMPLKKRFSTLKGNVNAKRQMRRIEIGWMDFDEIAERYKQVKSVNGGGTRHLSIEKEKTVADVKVLAESLFFPEGFSKKNMRLSNYSTHIESSQMNICVSDTIEQLYSLCKVKLLRLYLCTKKKMEWNQAVEEDNDPKSQSSMIDLTENDQSQIVENLATSNQHAVGGISTSEDLELDDTLVWDGHFTVSEDEESDTVVILHARETVELRVDEPNNQAIVSEGTEDFLTVEHSASAPNIAEQTSTDAEAMPEQQFSPVTVIVRRGHCLTDLMCAFKDPKVLTSEITIKMRLPNGELEQGEGAGVFRDSLTEFWTEFYDCCTLGVQVKVPFIRHDFQLEEWQAVARVFVVGWKQVSYFPVKLAVPFLEEVLYGSVASSLKESLLMYVSQEEKDLIVKALEDFDSVESDELLDFLGTLDCRQLPTKDTLLPILTQMGHKLIIQAPNYVIKCWQPILHSISSSLPRHDLEDFITQKKTDSKKSQGPPKLSRGNDSRPISDCSLSEKVHRGNRFQHSSSLFTFLHWIRCFGQLNNCSVCRNL